MLLVSRRPLARDQNWPCESTNISGCRWPQCHWCISSETTADIKLDRTRRYAHMPECLSKATGRKSEWLASSAATKKRPVALTLFTPLSVRRAVRRCRVYWRIQGVPSNRSNSVWAPTGKGPTWFNSTNRNLVANGGGDGFIAGSPVSG